MEDTFRRTNRPAALHKRLKAKKPPTGCPASHSPFNKHAKPARAQASYAHQYDHNNHHPEFQGAHDTARACGSHAQYRHKQAWPVLRRVPLLRAFHAQRNAIVRAVVAQPAEQPFHREGRFRVRLPAAAPRSLGTIKRCSSVPAGSLGGSRFSGQAGFPFTSVKDSYMTADDQQKRRAPTRRALGRCTVRRGRLPGHQPFG